MIVIPTYTPILKNAVYARPLKTPNYVSECVSEVIVLQRFYDVTVDRVASRLIQGVSTIEILDEFSPRNESDGIERKLFELTPGERKEIFSAKSSFLSDIEEFLEKIQANHKEPADLNVLMTKGILPTLYIPYQKDHDGWRSDTYINPCIDSEHYYNMMHESEFIDLGYGKEWKLLTIHSNGKVSSEYHGGENKMSEMRALLYFLDKVLFDPTDALQIEDISPKNIDIVAENYLIMRSRKNESPGFIPFAKK